MLLSKANKRHMGGHKFLSLVLGLSQKPRGTGGHEDPAEAASVPPWTPLHPCRVRRTLGLSPAPGGEERGCRWRRLVSWVIIARSSLGERSCDSRARERSLPGFAERRRGRVWNEHPTVRRRRLLLLLGAPDMERRVLLGGPGRTGLRVVALRWRRQWHLLGRLLRRPALVEEHTWAPARPPFPARRRTPPPRRRCGGRQRVRGRGPSSARAARQPEPSGLRRLLGRGTAPPRGEGGTRREPR